MTSDALLIASFALYTVLIIGVGLYSSKRQKKTDEDFVLANRELGPWVSALSASASAESGWVMLGLVGMAFSSGLSAFWIVPGIAAGYLFNWFVLAERLRKASAASGSVTLPQYICHRFGADSKALRIISVTIITAAMLGYVAAQMNAAGKAFDAVFQMPYWIGVLVGAGIILTYTVIGGFRAICWTDVVQAGFMFIALIAMPIITYFQFGSWAEVASAIASIESSNPDIELLSLSGGKAGGALIGFVIGMLGIGLGYPGQPHILSRFMALEDSGAANRGGKIAFSWFLIVYTGAIIFGLLARAHFGNIGDPEQALPLAVTEFLPPILGGFVIAAIVSSICSTADSQLIVVSSALSRDVFGWGKADASGGGQQFIRLDRIVLVVIGLLSVLFALSENRVIFVFVLYAWGVLGAAFGPVMILGLLWPKANRQGAIAGMLTGAIVAIVWKEVSVLSSALYELVPAFILAFAAIIIVSLMTQQSKDSMNQ